VFNARHIPRDYLDTLFVKSTYFESIRAFLVLTLITIVVTSGRATFAEDAQRVFRAGAATSNITPPLGSLIVGGWQPIPATHVHDELYARCLVLDDGTLRLAIVLCDNVGIPQEVFDVAKAMAWPVIGGMAVELLTLFVVPVLYAGFKEFKMNVGMEDRHWKGTEDENEGQVSA